MQQLINSGSILFDMGNNRLDFINDLFLFYFHNVLVSNSILHLHMRIKTMTRKSRHLFKGFSSIESVIVNDFDVVLRNKNIDTKWYDKTLLFTYR